MRAPRMPTKTNDKEALCQNGTGLFKTAAIATHRTKKVQKPIVLFCADFPTRSSQDPAFILRIALQSPDGSTLTLLIRSR